MSSFLSDREKSIAGYTSGMKVRAVVSQEGHNLLWKGKENCLCYEK